MRAAPRRCGLVAVLMLVANGWHPRAAEARPEDLGLRGHGGPVRAMTVLADGRTLVTAGFDGAIIVWDVTRNAALRVLRFHDGVINAVTALNGDCFASAGEDMRIAIWCGTDGKPAQVLAGHTGPIVALARSAQGDRLASAAWDGTARVWSLDQPESQLRIISGHTGPVNGVAFVRDGAALVTVGYDGQVRLSSLAADKPALVLKFPTPLNAVAMSDSVRLFVAGADGSVRGFEVEQQLMQVLELRLEQGPLTALAATPDGRMLVAAGMQTPVTLIPYPFPSQRTQILGPGLPVWSLAFVGPELFTGGADHAIRRWDPATAKPSGQDVAAPAAEAAKETERGAQVFRACRACHSLETGDTSRAGPTLAGLFGRRIASVNGYAYSDALRKLDIVWTPETVSRLFQIGPNAYTPGTKMPEQRLTDPEDRKALIEWLQRVTAPK